MNFFFNVNFWGERYTRFFLQYSLPSQLAEGNIPYMISLNQGTIKYRIYTTKEDSFVVTNSPVYKKLCKLVEAEIFDFEEFDIYNRHNRGTMTLCHAHAIQYANSNDYSLLFIWPDTIYSNNSFGTLCDLALSGKTSVLVGSLTVHTGNFLGEMSSRYDAEDVVLDISPRELVAMGARNLCSQSEQWKWDSPNFNYRSSWIFWDVPGEGLLQRSFHLTPVLLTPDDKTLQLPYDPLDELGLDGNGYLDRAMDDISSMHLITDSDNFLCISFNDEALPVKQNRSRAIDVAMYACGVFLQHHLSLFRNKLRFHYAELSPEWYRTEDLSDMVVHTIVTLIKLAETYPEIVTINDERNAAIEEKNQLIQIANTEFIKQRLRIAEVLNELGKLQFEVGRKDQAIINFTTAIEIAPEQSSAHLNLARLYAHHNEYYLAFVHVGNVIKIDPQNDEALMLANKIINEQSVYSNHVELADQNKTCDQLNILIVVPRFIASYGQYYTFPLGLAYISAVLKQSGFNVYTINLNHQLGQINELIISSITKNNINVVCTGGLSIHYQKVKEIIDSVKSAQKDVITIVGGGLLSSEPEVVMDGLATTYGVIGEGERTIVELARALQSGTYISAIDGIIYRTLTGQLTCTAQRKPIDDIDSIPYPDYEGLGFSDYLENMISSDERELAILDNPHPISLISSRSCPFSCTFCYHPIGKKYRQRSLESFFAELEHWVELFNINIVFVMDELFSLQSERIYEFCDRIKKMNLKWVVQLTVKGISEEVLTIMRDAGCYLISYGLESGNNDVLKSMKKPITVADIQNVMELTYSARIGVQGNFIFGDVAETVESIIDTLSLWLRLQQKHYIYMIPIEVYPGTELYNGAVSKGIINDKLNYIVEGCPSINLTAMSNNLYLRSLLLVYILRKSFLAIPAKLLDFKPIAIHPIKGQLYKVRVLCPHCSEIVDIGNLAYFDDFMTGCRLCYRRFDIFDTIRKPGLQINTLLSKSDVYSEDHKEEMRQFLTLDNFDWLLKSDLILENRSEKYMAIKLFNNTYIVPQEISADAIRYGRFRLILLKDGDLFEF